MRYFYAYATFDRTTTYVRAIDPQVSTEDAVAGQNGTLFTKEATVTVVCHQSSELGAVLFPQVLTRNFAQHECEP